VIAAYHYNLRFTLTKTGETATIAIATEHWTCVRCIACNDMCKSHTNTRHVRVLRACTANERRKLRDYVIITRALLRDTRALRVYARTVPRDNNIVVRVRRDPSAKAAADCCKTGRRVKGWTVMRNSFRATDVIPPCVNQITMPRA